MYKNTTIHDLGASLPIEFSFDPEFIRFYKRYLNSTLGRKKLKLLGLHPDQMNVPLMSYKYFKEGTRAVSVDVNANIGEVRSPNNYWAEVSKGVTKLNCFYLIWRYASKLFGKEEASRLCSYILDGKLYFHDMSGPTKLGVPYCFAWSSYNLIVDGRPWNDLQSRPPKRYDSFISCVIETVMEMSQEFAGALAIPDLCLNFTWYLLKEFTSEQILNSDSYIVFGNRSLTYIIENEFQRFIHVMNNKFRTGAECVDEETEVLTPDGFKKYNELNVGDDIYVWKDGKLAVEKVLKVNVYDYDGEMHVYEGKNYIQQVTPNHKILRCKYNDSGYKLQFSSDIIDFKSPIYFPVAVSGLSDETGIDLEDNEIELLAFLLTDGSISDYKVRIYKSPNRWGNERLKELLESLGIQYNITERNNYFGCNKSYGKYKVYSYNLSYPCVKKYITILNGTKNDIPDILLKMNSRQSKLFLETWAKLDGYTTVGGSKKEKIFRMRIQCDNFDIADKLQHIAFRAGFTSRIMTRVFGNSSKPTIYLIVYNQKNKSATKKYKIHYRGKVWCPTTKAGIVVFRKNGKLFISGNSPFSNVSFYDKDSFLSVYEQLVFPDGTRAIDIYDCFRRVQEIWMKFMGKKDPISGKPYRFPVATISLFIDPETREYTDPEFVDFVSQVNTDGVFNIYVTDDKAKTSSCCRLLNDIEEVSKRLNIDSFGNGGISLGSNRVVTVNLARLAMDTIKYGNDKLYDLLDDRLDAAKKLLIAHRYLVKKRIEKGMLKFFRIGWADLDRMFFNTIGIIGLNEMVNYLGYDITKEEGIEVAGNILSYIKETSIKFADETGQMFNTEQIPGESAAITLAELDRLVYDHPYTMYANQFVPLWVNVDLATRARIDGKLLHLFSGGAISHLNVTEELKPTHVKALMKMAAKCGLEHFAINPRFAVCENGHASVTKEKKCPICGAPIKDYITRIVGYFVSVDKDFNYIRRNWEFPKRSFFTKEDFDDIVHS